MVALGEDVLLQEPGAGAGGTRSRTLTVDASGGGCSEVPARRRR